MAALCEHAACPGKPLFGSAHRRAKSGERLTHMIHSSAPVERLRSTHSRCHGPSLSDRGDSVLAGFSPVLARNVDGAPRAIRLGNRV